jgi:hypothetical protein
MSHVTLLLLYVYTQIKSCITYIHTTTILCQGYFGLQLTLIKRPNYSHVIERVNVVKLLKPILCYIVIQITSTD